MLYWVFNTVLGLFLVLSALWMGYIYWRNNTNGLSYAIVLLIVQFGFVMLTNSLLALGLDVLLLVGVVGQIWLVVTIVYFVKQVLKDEEAKNNTNQDKPTTKESGPDRKAGARTRETKP